MGICDPFIFNKRRKYFAVKTSNGLWISKRQHSKYARSPGRHILPELRKLSEPKRNECWQTLNQNFWFHHFETIISPHLIPPIVFLAWNDWSRALKKNSGQKKAGLCARPFETWHKAPLFFHNHDSNSIHVLTSTLKLEVRWKNSRAPEWSRRWSGEWTGTNTISLD